jgi:hypothetical protein
MALVVGTNSWTTLTEANDYLDGKFGSSSWLALSNDDKESALISAFRWIRRLDAYNIPASSTAEKVKFAQIELAYYITVYWTEHEQRDALQAQGVENFSLSKWRESLGKAQLPQIVEDLLSDELLNAGGYFPTFTRELDVNN